MAATLLHSFVERLVVHDCGPGTAFISHDSDALNQLHHTCLKIQLLFHLSGLQAYRVTESSRRLKVSGPLC